MIEYSNANKQVLACKYAAAARWHAYQYGGMMYMWCHANGGQGAQACFAGYHLFHIVPLALKQQDNVLTNPHAHAGGLLTDGPQAQAA